MTPILWFVLGVLTCALPGVLLLTLCVTKAYWMGFEKAEASWTEIADSAATLITIYIEREPCDVRSLRHLSDTVLRSNPPGFRAS